MRCPGPAFPSNLLDRIATVEHHARAPAQYVGGIIMTDIACPPSPFYRPRSVFDRLRRRRRARQTRAYRNIAGGVCRYTVPNLNICAYIDHTHYYLPYIRIHRQLQIILIIV